jgi:hypothetical protein
MTTITSPGPAEAICRACGKPMHRWQDSSGSGWMHDTAADEYLCWPPPNLDQDEL